MQALVRMSDVEQATWAMQNLHMSTAQDGTQPMLVRYADSPEDKVRRVCHQSQFAAIAHCISYQRY